MEVILAGSFHFGGSLAGFVSGEDIWARSSIDTFKELGYTILYAYDLLEILDIYLEIPDLIKIVIMEHGGLDDCLRRGVVGYERLLDESEVKGGGRIIRLELEGKSIRNEIIEINPETQLSSDGIKVHELMKTKSAAGFTIKPFGWKAQYGHRYSTKSTKLDPTSPDYEPHERWRCIKHESFMEGIPAWKIFGFKFWDGSITVLGPEWTLAPEDYGSFPSNKKRPEENNFFLGE